MWPDSDARSWFLPMIYKLLRYNRLVNDSAPQIAWPSKQASAYASVSFFFIQLWSGNVDSKRSVSKASASAVDDSYTRSLPELSFSLSSSGSQDIPRWVFLQQKCYAGDCNLLSKETFLWMAETVIRLEHVWLVPKCQRRRARKPEVNISHGSTVVSARFSK